MSESRSALWDWASRAGAIEVSEAFGELRQRIDRAFDQVWRGFPLTPTWSHGQFRPSADISETDREVRLSIELPGMERGDVEVLVAEDILTIKGEKRSKKQKEGRGYALTERSYGAFERNFHLPTEVEPGGASAAFESGVLTVTVPKKAAAQKPVRKIAVERAGPARAAARKKAPAGKSVAGKKAAARKPARKKAAAG
jgi:HSP20 family protein